MDVIEAILTRRSVRRYTGEPITDEQLRQVLRAGCYAPSAHNGQPWQFVVLRSPETLGALASVHPYAKMAPQAGTAVVVCGDSSRQKTEGFLVEDCSAAIENMLLAARSLGLGSVWCGIHPVTKLVNTVRTLLALPQGILPIGLVVLGHSAEDRAVEERFDEAKVHWEKW